MKDIKEYLPFYIGQRVYDSFNDIELILTPKSFAGYMEHWEKPEDGQIKPILRPLSDMTEEEKYYNKEIDTMHNSDKIVQRQREAERTAWLLKRGFDLFQLIPEGLAIDAKTLTPNTTKP